MHTIIKNKHIFQLPYSFLFHRRNLSLSGQKFCHSCKRRDPWKTKLKDPFAEHSPSDTYLIYKVISLVVAIPLVALLSGYLYYTREDHGRPPFIRYSYLRHITKDYPWADGKHSFFHNPKKNALKDGYEEDE